MSLALELPTSVLVGVRTPCRSPATRPPSGLSPGPGRGGGSTADLTAAVDETLGTLKGPPLAHGADGVYYPGERSTARDVERAADGVPVAPKVWRDLTERAAPSGIRPPGTG